MEKKIKALLLKAELLHWLCQKELYYRKVDELRRECVRERDEAERAERSFFAKLCGNYEERFGKEKAEAIKIQLELERIEKVLADAEERIPALKEMLQEDFSFEEDFTGEEKELSDWCTFMERAYEVIALTNKCLEEGWAERTRSYSNPGNLENCIVFQEDVEELYRRMDGFLSMVGRVRYLQGTRINVGFGRTNRTTVYGGKTFMFFRKGYATVQIDLHELDFKNLWGGLAFGDALERKLKEIELLEKLFSGITKEYLLMGEELRRKVKMNGYHVPEKDIFGFEK